MPSFLLRPRQTGWSLLGLCLTAVATALTPHSLQAQVLSESSAAITPVRVVQQQNLAPVEHALKQATSHAALLQEASLHSEAVYVQDVANQQVLYDKASTEIRPIASISKLMMALVVVEAGLDMDELLSISDADVDRLRYSRSRLPVGAVLSRGDLLHLALMSSENRAAHALGRHYPGGMPAFVRAMNDRARSLGMRQTQFVEPTGLSSENVSSARDLVKLMRATAQHPLIRQYSTNEKYDVNLTSGRQLAYRNTNRLVTNDSWDIQISKTGFINEAGECLVMLTRFEGRDVAIVLLNATPRSRINDALRVRSLVLNTTELALQKTKEKTS